MLPEPIDNTSETGTGSKLNCWLINIHPVLHSVNIWTIQFIIISISI